MREYFDKNIFDQETLSDAEKEEFDNIFLPAVAKLEAELSEAQKISERSVGKKVLFGAAKIITSPITIPVKVVQVIGRFFMSLTPLRRYLTPSGKKQLDSLVKHSKAVVSQKKLEKESLSAAEVAAREYGKKLFQEYSKLSNQQVKEGTYHEQEANQKRNQRVESIKAKIGEKYSANFKLSGVKEVPQEKRDECIKIAQTTFENLLIGRVQHVAEARTSVEKLYTRLKIVEQPAKGQSIKETLSLSEFVDDQIIKLRKSVNAIQKSMERLEKISNEEELAP